MKRIFLITLINITAIFSVCGQFDDRFYFPTKEWDEIGDINYEELFFNIDTVQLNAIFLKPETDPKATILFFHGSGGNVSTYSALAKPFVNSGFQVFMLDPRGYGKSTGKPTHLNIVHDAQFVLDSLLKRKDIKNTKMLIYGASIGTQVATRIAKDNQTQIDGLILDGTMSSFTDLALVSAPPQQKQIISQYVTSPYSAKEDIKEIKNIPKLFIHSKTDQSVPFSQAKNVFENARQPKAFWIYKGKHLEAIINQPSLLLKKVSNLIH